MRSSAPNFSTVEFDVVVTDQGTTRTVTPVGDVDAASIPQARGPLEAALADGFENVVLDLGETTFLDSTGVHLVLDSAAQARARGLRFVVLPGEPQIQRVFELCGQTDIPLLGGNGDRRAAG